MQMTHVVIATPCHPWWRMPHQPGYDATETAFFNNNYNQPEFFEHLALSLVREGESFKFRH
jgi:hypothetical protein